MAGIYDLSDPGARSRYAALHRSAGRATPFSSLTFADAAAHAYRLRGRIHLPIPDAGALILERGRGLLRRAVLPPFTQYSALILPDFVAESDVHARTGPLEKILESIERAYRRADLLCRLEDPRPAGWRNWQVSPLYTYLLPAALAPDTWSTAARRLYRTRKSRYECRESADLAREVIVLCEQSYARHGRRLPGGPAALLQMVRQLKSMTRIFVALEEGAPKAGIVVLCGGSAAHYWISGSQPGAAMTVLIGHVLGVLQSSGFDQFDLVGANTPSIAEFKRRFGPQLALYFHLRHHPLTGLIS
ncbi:MAG: GNAT family N-acetyltransferase [Bacteroidota bacterium]|nr:GNAT family N-acetyltransferase [Bacteroidota bacterium]MDE2957575.1 GNAT family N-acetyltransferase [Bacteroidota bacterium]